MKKCSVIFILLCLVSVFMTSCTSIKGLLNPDFTVSYGESVQTVKERVAKIEKSNTYMKKFTTKDKMGNTHQVIIYDKQYMKVDKVIYAYKFDALMYYQLVLNVLGSVQTVSGSEKVIGITGYASPIENPDLAYSYIFARELFGQKGYSSRYEACQIDGVYFAGIQFDEGYIDDFGKWVKYDWWDYFEKIFNTTSKDVRSTMYMAFSQQ